MNFIKKIFDGQADELVHQQLVRFGKGDYNKRAVVSLWKTKKIKFKSSFEFVNDLVNLCSNLGNAKASGIVLSKKDISNILSENKINGNSETKKGGLYYKNNIFEQELNKGQLLILVEECYAVLLDLEGGGFNLKIKKKLPKPGKSEGKIDDKFCQLEVDERFYSQIRDDLFWDLPEGKKIRVTHNFLIKDVIKPKGEKDYAKIREFGKRKGKIVREIEIDGVKSTKEIEFEA